MKRTLTTLMLLQTLAAFGTDNRVLIPPFENLSSRRAHDVSDEQDLQRHDGLTSG